MLPNNAEPKSGANTSDVSNKCASKQDIDMSSLDEEVDHKFEIVVP